MTTPSQSPQEPICEGCHQELPNNGSCLCENCQEFVEQTYKEAEEIKSRERLFV
jgi:predicted amidophosphoribosyltransferase